MSQAHDFLLDGVAKTLPKQIAGQAWVADSSIRAASVALYRRYADGDFDAMMTVEQRQALRIAAGREIGPNHCDTVIGSMADRLTVTGITADNKAATAWLQAVADWNRLDGFQMDVHESTLRDADTYVMVDWDNDAGRVRWTHEPAYDGIEGMIGIPKSRRNAELAAAVKLWHETREQFADTLRVNIYLENEIRRYIDRFDTRGLVPYEGTPEDPVEPVSPWVDKAGNPLGVPVVHFANRRLGAGGFGISELNNVIGLQDWLNRTAHSIAMTTETAGFGIRGIIGYEPEADVVPGTVIAITAKDDQGNPKTPNADELAHLNAIRTFEFKASELKPQLETYDKIEQQIAKTTRTPDAGGVSDDASGEARKQAEVGLVGKIRRFQVKAGNGWEDVARLSVRVNDAFSPTPAPKAARWVTGWRSPEIRNDNDVINQAVALENLAGLRAALTHAATVTGWDEAQIEKIMAEREAHEERALQQLLNVGPGYAGRPAAPALPSRTQ